MRASRHPYGLAALTLALVLALALPASGASGTPERVEPDRPAPWDLSHDSDAEFADDLWFVEFAAPPGVRGGSPAAHANERARLAAEARREGVDFAEQRDFTMLWNGLSVRAGLEDITVIRGFDNVEAVYPVAVIDAPQPDDVDPQLATALAMTGADHAQDLGFTGDGLSVAIIDTGIDYNHPDLGGDGDIDNRIEAAPDRTFDHPRITHGWDYVGDEFDASDPATPPPDPNPDPFDIHGHGTHVAGIAGANADDPETGVTGVAPEVTFGAYKVFATGSTTADVIVDALEDAFEDGMDIVNMSLGATLVWGQDYPTTATSNELAAQGVVVVNSAGNDGPLGMWSMSAPANAHDIISVASADNTFFNAFVFEVAQLDVPIPYMELEGAELPPTEGESEEVVWLGRACVDTEGDDLLDDPDGRVALIARGDCTFAEKYLAAGGAGATGVVIHNNVPGMFAGTILDDGVEGVWGAGISMADGLALRDLIEDGETVVLEFTDETETLPNPTGGLVSSFSSYGQDVELAYGPSILAPGGLINSTWPGNRYATISGTSMSAPHVAGAAALLLEAEPGLDPFEVRDRLQNTAEPAPWSLNPDAGFLDHTFRQGAGMLRIDRAVTAVQRVAPGQIAVSKEETPDVTLTLWNDDDEDVTYTVGHEGTLGASVSTFAPVFLLPGGDVSAPETVTVPAGGSAELTVTIVEPGFGLPNHQYGGYVVLTPDDEDLATLRVPYSGYDGDYQELPLFGYFVWPEDEPVQFVEQEPRLSEIVYDEEGAIEGFRPVDPGHIFTIRDGDFPVVEAFFGHFPQTMELHAVDQRRGHRYLLLRDHHLSRSPSPDFYWPFAWAGTTQAGRSDNARTVPSGTYTLEVSVLRTLGDPDNDAHWDTWESPEFQIDTRRGGPPAVPGPPAGRGPGR